MQATKPDLNTPILREPAQQTPPAPIDDLGPLKHLLGTWTNQPLREGGKGGPDDPYSYCVMPLPQKDPDTSPQGYILKNFKYYEEVTFSAIHGAAPNRGGLGTQVANTVFYEQRVYFAEGPRRDALVHAENGSFLYLTGRKQFLGPYGNGNEGGVGHDTVPGSTPPTSPFQIVKQVSVPHGNSILALGHYEERTTDGQLVILGKHSVLPSLKGNGFRKPYTEQGPGNPDPVLTHAPINALNAALIPPNQNPGKYILLSVGTRNDEGGDVGTVTNIGFEESHANVTEYSARYWLEDIDTSGEYKQLQYSQYILMEFNNYDKKQFPNVEKIQFPHVTVNTLRKN